MNEPPTEQECLQAFSEGFDSDWHDNNPYMPDSMLWREWEDGREAAALNSTNEETNTRP